MSACTFRPVNMRGLFVNGSNPSDSIQHHLVCIPCGEPRSRTSTARLETCVRYSFCLATRRWTVPFDTLASNMRTHRRSPKLLKSKDLGRFQVRSKADLRSTFTILRSQPAFRPFAASENRTDGELGDFRTERTFHVRLSHRQNAASMPSKNAVKRTMFVTAREPTQPPSCPW